MSVEDRYRRFLLLVAGGLFLGLPVELWLEEHTGDWIQRIPFGLCALGLGAVLWAWLAGTRAALLTLRGTMLIIGAGTAYGVYSHLSHNLAFEREIRPSAAWSDVIVEALFGASPLFAPAALGVAALLAAAATFWHPGLRPS